MVIIEPYKQNNYYVYPGDVRTIKLSFAVWLIDDFTGEQAIGNIRVLLKKSGTEAIKNLSGYYIFTDLAEGQYTVDILSDLYFFEVTTPIDTKKIKLSDVSLVFDTIGPAPGATSIKLQDVSRLQKDDIVEFRNLNGKVEQRNIDIDDSTGTISWAEVLEHDYSDGTILVLQNPVITVRLTPLPSYPFHNNATLVRGLIIDAGNNPVAEASVKVESEKIRTESDKKGEFLLYFTKVKFSNNGKILISIIIDIEKNGHTGSLNQTLEEGKTKYLKILYKDGQFVVMN